MHKLEGIKEIKKTGILDEKRFYALLSSRCNYISPETVKDFYLSLVKLISVELRENGIIRLPHLGDIILVKQKDKLGFLGTRRGMVKGAHMIKFQPFYAFKEYFSRLEGQVDTLDPREKLLNRKVKE